MSVLIFKMPNNGIPFIYRHFTVHQQVYGTFNDKTERGIPIYRLLSRYTALWQKNVEIFRCLGFRGRILFLSSSSTKRTWHVFPINSSSKKRMCNEHMWYLIFPVSRSNTDIARQQATATGQQPGRNSNEHSNRRRAQGNT